MDREDEDVNEPASRTVAVAIIACYALVVVSLSLAAAWLLLPAPTVQSTGAIMFSNTLPTDSFSLEIKQGEDGVQTVTIGNTGSSVTTVKVSLDIPANTPPDTWSTSAFLNDRNVIPLHTITESAIRPGSVCQASGSTLGNVICSFTLAATETRSFSWRHPTENWIAHRGSRWSVQTPIVSMNNVGYSSIVQQGMADPRSTITAAVPLPSGSAVVSGPPLSWNYAAGVAMFTYSSSGQIDAPLVINYATQYVETFTLFGIAALERVEAPRGRCRPSACLRRCRRSR